MRIQYASDLHLEFRENSSFLKHNPLAVAGEVLVLAGDIGYIGDENYSRHPFWDWASGNYSRVIVVPGNHEFYKMFDIDKLYNGWSLKIRENITCHYNAVIPLGNDIELIATTLWSHILLQDAYETEAAITDFRRMRYGSEPLDWTRFNDEHSRCFRFLEQSVKQSTARHLIVATHHVPSFELMGRSSRAVRSMGHLPWSLAVSLQTARLNTGYMATRTAISIRSSETPGAYATSWAMCSVTSIRHSIRKRIFRFKSAIHKSRLSAKVNIRQTDGLLCNKFMVDY